MSGPATYRRPFKVKMVRVATGEERIIDTSWGFPGYSRASRDEPWWHHAHYMWKDGNNSCDCNRASDWFRAEGMDGDAVWRSVDEDGG